MNKYWAWIAVAFLFVAFGYMYYQANIDGRYINKPIVFYVDTMHFKTDKKEYKAGDGISIFTSACRNYPFTADITWRIDTTVLRSSTQVNPQGCVLDTWFEVGKIPDNVHGTKTLDGVFAIHINPQNIIYMNFKSEEFTVK